MIPTSPQESAVIAPEDIDSLDVRAAFDSSFDVDVATVLADSAGLPPDQALVHCAQGEAPHAGDPDESERLQRQLQEMRTIAAVQRANAEHARRMVACLQSFQQSLLESLAQPCYLLDNDGCVMFWNRAMADWTGISVQQAFGRPLSELASPTGYAQLAAAHDAARCQGENERVDVVTATETGCFLAGRRFEQVTVLPLCRIPGTVEATFALVTLPKS